MLAFLRRHLAVFLVCGAALAVALGVHGFLAMNANTTVATALYRGMQLFYWNYFPWDTTAEARIPWTLETARWLAPVMTLGTLLHLVIGVFHRRWDAWRARRLRGHILIGGAGEIAKTLVADAALHGHRVVALGADVASTPGASPSEVIALQSSSIDLPALQAAGVASARRIVIATDDDPTNLALAATIAQQPRSEGATIHAHCSDPALSALFQRQFSAAAVPLRLFSEVRNVARRVIRSFPAESPVGEAHVILPALDRLGLALAIDYALVGHFTEDRCVHLHVVAPDAGRAVRGAREHFPAFDRCLHLSALECSGEGEFSARVAQQIATLPKDARVTVFAGWESEAHALARALSLHEQVGPRESLRVILPGVSEGSARQLVNAHPGLRERVGFLPQPAECGGYEAVIGESLDRSARIIHEHWLAETRRQIEVARAAGDEALAQRHEAKATFRPWDALTEEQKGASRSQADHLAVKVRAAGLDPERVTAAEWAQLTPAQIEPLARMEHARWAAYLWMTGWSHGHQRDDARKLHPDLVGYDALDEPTKDYDRAAVRQVGALLAVLA